MNRDEEAYVRRRVKIELRRRMRAVRSALPREARAERSAKITERVLALEALKSAQCVAAFAAIRSEVDPSAIVASLRSRGVDVAFPRIDEQGSLTLHVCAPERLEPGTWDIPEPPHDARRPVRVDVILVPGLAFDPRGHRVGYGKGYYDRLLAQWPDAYSVALGFDFQLVPETPNLPNDVPVSCIVTDKRTMVAS